jgi:hypothetical protein
LTCNIANPVAGAFKPIITDGTGSVAYATGVADITVTIRTIVASKTAALNPMGGEQITITGLGFPNSQA